MYNLRYSFQNSNQSPESRSHLYAGIKLIGYNFVNADVIAKFGGTEQEYSFKDNYVSVFDGDDWRIGFLWQYNPTMGLFIEYRATNLSMEISRSDAGSFERELVEFEIKPSINQINLGLSYKF